MISLYFTTKDPYSLYGINHFVRKYEIPVRINRKDNSEILVIHGDRKTPENKFVIKIHENKDNSDLEIFNIIHKIKSDKKIGNQECNLMNEFIIVSDDLIEIKLDVFNVIGFILSGKLIDLNIDPMVRKILSEIPIVDCIEHKLFQCILYAAQQVEIPIIHKTFWPDNKKFAVCLTHDVDEIRKTYQYLTHFMKHLLKREFSRAWYHFKSFFTDKIFRRNPYWTFDEIVKVEGELGVRSTFFFLKEKAKVDVFRPSTWHHYARRYDFKDPKVANIIRQLALNGWEVGLHGSYFSYLSVDRLKEEKKDLEDVLGNKIYGIRQHHLNLKVPDTWIYQEMAGFEYDTSLGFKGGEGIGFKLGTCFPFYPYANGRILSLLEIPLTIMDICVTPCERDWKMCTKIISEVEKYEGVLTLLWHHTVFNDKEYPGWAEMYKKLIEFCKKKDAWVTNACEIARWWKTRKQKNIEYGYENGIVRINSEVEFIKIHYPKNKRIKILSSNAKILKKEDNSIIISIEKDKLKDKLSEVLIEVVG